MICTEEATPFVVLFNEGELQQRINSFQVTFSHCINVAANDDETDDRAVLIPFCLNTSVDKTSVCLELFDYDAWRQKLWKQQSGIPKKFFSNNFKFAPFVVWIDSFDAKNRSTC